ncbi:MAG: nucleotidyltransferase domain-containing protein [Gaiellaceae bacterium]
MPKRATPPGDGPSPSEALAFASWSAAVWSSQLVEMVRSVILQGSLTLGDHIPGRSDVDLLMVVDRSLEEKELERLSQTATAENARAPCRVDLRIVTAAATATPTEAPPMEIYLELDPRSRPTLDGRGQRERDLVVELSICREHGRSLRGAAPRELIAEVPHEWVVNAGDQQLADWQLLTDDAKHAELMVLTACRIWRFHDEHIHCTKSAAGAWALARDPSLQAVRDALKRRNGDPKVSIEPDDIARLLATVRALLAAKRSAR